MMKIILKFLVISLSLIGFASPLLAQTDDYRLLEPIPYVETSAGHTDAETYIPGVIKLVIALAGALAVIMIVIGGIQYMITDSLGTKANAKKTIENAIWGFVLTISAWLLLYTINPKLVEIDLTIEQVKSGPPLTASSSPITLGRDWPDDQTMRDKLKKDLNITVKEPKCATVGQRGCTSVYGISTAVYNGLSRLRNACRNCVIEITGGTEYWLHNVGTAHREGGRVIDLRVNQTLDAFIKSPSAGTRVTTAGCATSNEKYALISGGTYVLNDLSEATTGNHWHVCY